MNDAFVIISPEWVGPRVFATGGAVKVTAYGLAGGDCITFRKVEETAANPSFGQHGCRVSAPTDAEIALAADYKVGTCAPSLHGGRNTLYIKDAGKYLPVLAGLESAGGLTVKVEPVALRDFSAAELGIEPCGCLCTDSVWTWTGAERVNGEMVEREYVSECGTRQWREERAVEWVWTGVERCVNQRVHRQETTATGRMRWKETEVVCGYSPSVPLVVGDGCGGRSVGYMFSPDELRPPEASVALTGCSGKVYGYIWPEAATGRTLQVSDCAGNVSGYLANRSDTAAVLVGDCGCAGNAGHNKEIASGRGGVVPSGGLQAMRDLSGSVIGYSVVGR